MKLVAYTRVSRVGGRDVESESFITVKEQLRQIESYADAMGHEIVAHFSDLDQSGGKESRPEFDKALAMATNGADGLIVAKLDRFSRSVEQALKILRSLHNAGKQIVSVSDSVDTSSAMGRAMWQIIMVFAELERERASENWKAALRNAVVDRGIHVASRTPTGYQRREDGRLEPHPQAAPVVAELFHRRARGAGWSELARYLNESGVVGPYKAKNWTHTAVAKIIKNRAYLGEARNGQHVNPDAHEAIVTEGEWQAANIRKGTTAPARARDTSLSGLLRCAGCRYLLKADKLTDRKGEKLRIYRCRGDHAAGKCPNKAYVMARVIEPYVEQQFLAELGPNGRLASAAQSTAEIAEAERAVEAAAQELDVYVETTAVAIVGADRYQRGLATRKAALDAAQAKLAELRARVPAEGLTVDLVALWPDLSATERRRLLTSSIDAVMIRKGGSAIEDRVKILWRGEAPSDLPRRGLRPALQSFDF